MAKEPVNKKEDKTKKDTKESGVVPIERNEVQAVIDPNKLIEDVSEMPIEMRERVFSFLGMFSKSASRHNPLFDKFNDSHIDKYLDGIQEDDNNDYKMRSTNRFFNLAYFLLVVIALGLLMNFLLPIDKDLLMVIL